VRGCLGLRVEPGDVVAGVAATSSQGGVFLLSADGKGTIRQLSGFAPNKAPGAGGKVAMKADALVGCAAVHEQMGERTDVFALSRLGKLIRFGAAEVPAKEGVVQGVNCMNLRADECVALAAAVVEPVVESV
jgi:DNA gyrase subunit A